MAQQKQIKKFLISHLGKETGKKVFTDEERILATLLEGIGDKTSGQKKMLRGTILPRVALYKALLENDKESTYDLMKDYMLNVVAAKKHSSTARIEFIPGFYDIYSRIFLRIMRTTDLQDSTLKIGKDFYDITINRCLWHDACVENGCPELCRLFCDVDDVTYGGLKKIGFSRTQTLGYDGTCCDFHFFKK